MPDDDKTFGGSLVLDWRIWWHHMHTLYIVRLPQPFFLVPSYSPGWRKPLQEWSALTLDSSIHKHTSYKAPKPPKWIHN